MNAPFLPFTRPSIDEETIEAVAAVLRSGWITSGNEVLRFEEELETYLGNNRKVRVFAHATGALEESLRALGIGSGDEVILPAMTFAATANVVCRVGARPVFADVSLRSRNIDLDDVARLLGPRTKAILPVHFAGLPVDMDRLYSLARSAGVRVIEDAAHAIGARWRGRPIGSFGDVVVFSFHANKNLTTIEGGAVSIPTQDTELLARLERLRFHGLRKQPDGSYDIEYPASKHNMSDVSACVGRQQLRHLDRWNARRRALAARYFSRLESSALSEGLPERGDEGHAWHLFSLLVPFAEYGTDRSRFHAAMRERGIGVGTHYPALPDTTFYATATSSTSCANARRIGRQTVTLPLFPAMCEGDVDRVCDTLADVLLSATSKRATL
jgi:dTDP-4-amino-4,6-dideoxygalactose transaminase